MTAAARPALQRVIPAVLRGSGSAEKRRLLRSFSSTLKSCNSIPEYARPDPSRPKHFGFETVTEAEKRERVAGVFTSVAETYDRMNDLMSFGWHRIWK